MLLQWFTFSSVVTKMDGALPLLWRSIPERYQLMGSKCQTCKGEYFPQRLLCPKCRSRGVITPFPMPEEGVVHSYTQVYIGPSGFEHETPYYLAMIELANGVKVLSQVVEVTNGEMKIGLPVKMVFRKIREDGLEGAIAYAYKFTPKCPIHEGDKPAPKRKAKK